MRLSTRLLANATTTYARMGTAILCGVFFTWYAIGKIGIAGLGMIALTSAAYSISAVFEVAIQRGLVREMAVAIASGEPQRVSRSLTSAAALCAPTALVMLLISGGLALVAHAGIFKTPADIPGLTTALAVLFLAEGVHGGLRLLCAPYTQALFAGQHIGLDNLLMGLNRATNLAAALIVFGLLLPGEAMAAQLIGFAVARTVLRIANTLLAVWLAKRQVRGLELRRSAYDRAEFRSILGTVWHTGQFVVFMNLNVQLMAVLINLFFGMTYNGVWQVAVQLGAFARMVAQGLLRGVDPLSTHLLEQGRRAAVVDLMMRTIRYQLGALLPVACGVSIFIYPILDLWVRKQIEMDPNLTAAGMSVAQAIDLIALMTWVHLAAQIAQSSMYGVERMLYGVGEVRSYSWFAKYGVTVNVGLAAVLVWVFDSPIAAPISLLVTYLICYPGVIFSAAVRRVGLPVGRTLARSLLRPFVAAVVLSAVMLAVRQQLLEVSLVTLIAVAAGAAIVHAALLYAVVLEADERSRLNELLFAPAEYLRGRSRGSNGRTDDETTLD